MHLLAPTPVSQWVWVGQLLRVSDLEIAIASPSFASLLMIKQRNKFEMNKYKFLCDTSPLQPVLTVPGVQREFLSFNLRDKNENLFNVHAILGFETRNKKCFLKIKYDKNKVNSHENFGEWEFKSLFSVNAMCASSLWKPLKAVLLHFYQLFIRREISHLIWDNFRRVTRYLQRAIFGHNSTDTIKATSSVPRWQYQAGFISSFHHFPNSKLYWPLWHW